MNRIVTESIGDQRTGMRRFHTKTRLCFGRFSPVESYSSGTLTKEGQKVPDRLIDVEGQQKIWFKEYEVAIDIGDAFDYESDGILKQIVNILALELDYDKFEFVRRDRAWPQDEMGMDGEVIRQTAIYQDRFDTVLFNGPME